ncbi:transposase [Streptomyces sp. NPDC057681]|uniref:transposase n=1 Tax=Streptomyces sp. NPDC057681 TaxID=3346209 RepID=UPI0036915BF4
MTNGQWTLLEPLLPQGIKPGRPALWTRRQLIDGIRWRTRTGAWDEGAYDDLVIRADRETGRSQALFLAGRDDHRWQFLAAERRAPAALLNRW